MYEFLRFLVYMILSVGVKVIQMRRSEENIL